MFGGTGDFGDDETRVGFLDEMFLNGDSTMGGVYYRTFLFSCFFHSSTYSPLKPYRKCYAFFFFELLVEKLVKNSLGKCSNEPSKSAVVDPPHCAIGRNRRKCNFQVDIFRVFFCIL